MTSGERTGMRALSSIWSRISRARIGQLSRLVLTSTFAAPQSGDTRQIESYYMYTWSEKVLTVDREGQVTLRVPPEVSDDTWQVYQTVSFDF